jgi:hypothetical protein
MGLRCAGPGLKRSSQTKIDSSADVLKYNYRANQDCGQMVTRCRARALDGGIETGAATKFYAGLEVARMRQVGAN